jgi:hypothetical protein
MNKYSERLYKYRSDVVASTVLGLVVMLIALSADPASSSTPSGALSPGLIEIQAPQEHQVHQPPPQEQNPTPPPTPSESSEADLDQQPEQTKKQEDTSVFGEVDQMEELDKPLTDAEITKRLEDYRQALIKGDLSIRLVGVSALSRKDLQSIARGYKVSSNGIAVYLDKQGHVCPAFRPEALTAPVQ